jgi:hypothetical protein
LSEIRICNAPGCGRHAVKPCFDCGQWRCEEHLLAAVHHRKSAIVHLCPNCLHAHVNNPERLRIDGYVDTQAERAADPLGAYGERRQSEITPLGANSILSSMPRTQSEQLWRIDDSLTTKSSPRTSRRRTTIEKA